MNLLEAEPSTIVKEASVPIEIRESGLRCMGSRHPEILLEGPAGTGKSFFAVYWTHQLCELFPGARFYFIRQTRKSLNQSALSLYEDLLGWGHPVLAGDLQRKGREMYQYPYAERTVDMGDGRGPITYRGRSEIYPMGMDNTDRIMSTEGDGAVFFEGTEGTLDGWDKLGTRLRRGYLPWNFRILDCNPAEATHWINKRADEPLEVATDVVDQMGDKWSGMNKMHRIRTTLKDNPKYWDSSGKWTELGLDYKIKLASLSPINRKRLEGGEWVSASGQVYASFSSAKHIVQGRIEKRGPQWHLVPIESEELGMRPEFEERRIAWFGIGVDYGFYPDPGVVQLWAFDEAQRGFMVKEHYETNVPREVWARRIADWQILYDVRAIECEHDPDMLRHINELIGHKMWKGHPIAHNAIKAIKPGIDVVRWALEDDDGQPDELGVPTCAPEPRLRILANALEREDDVLREELRSTSTMQEFPSYSVKQREDGKAYKTDMPDGSCDDHGLDATRYMFMGAWQTKHKLREEPETFAPGTMGAKHGHARRFKAATKRRR